MGVGGSGSLPGEGPGSSLGDGADLRGQCQNDKGSNGHSCHFFTLHSPQNSTVRLLDAGAQEVGAGERRPGLLALGTESHHEPVSAYSPLHLSALCHFRYPLTGIFILERLNSFAEF